MSRDIYDSVLKLVKNMLTQIPYFEMSDKEVEKYVNEKIDKVYKKYKDKRSILKYFERDFERTIKKKITDKLNNNNGYLEIINGYVNYISSKASDEKSLKVLNQLADFLLEYQFSSTPNKLISIIRYNTYLFNTIKYFVDHNKEKIINGKLGDLISNDLAVSFIEAYCMYNNIEIKEEYEDLEELSDENVDDKSIFYSDDSVRMLLHEIGQYKVLSDEEQKELIKKMHEGDNSAREKLIQTNLRLVVSIVRKHLGRGVDLLDLFQEGSHGLMNAIDKFDLEKDTKLSTYATWWIRQAVTRSVSDNARTIRVPVHVLEKYNKAVAARNKLEVELGRTPKPEEIADFLDMKVDELLKVLEYGNNDPLSLNSVISDGEDTEFENFIPSNDMSLEDRTFEQEKMQNMMVLLQKSNLSEREMDIIIRRYGLIDGETKTLEELGRFYGVTRERVRQLENKALAKLRNPRYVREFASYTDDPEESMRRVQNFTKEYYKGPHNSKKFVAKDKIREVKPREDHTIYKYLSNYSKESIDELISTLTPTSKEILRKRFGDDFDNPKVSDEWNTEDTRCFHRLLSYMKKKLENPNYAMRVKPIYKYFNRVDTFAIDTAIETLSLEEKALLKLRYGDDLHNPVYNIDWEYDLDNEGKLLKIVDKISDFISKTLSISIPKTTNSNNMKAIRNIYEYFSSYSKERIDLMISLLTEDELRLVKKKFGEKLNTYITRPKWGKDEASDYSHRVVAEMKKLLNNPGSRQPMSLCSIIPSCTEEELLYAASLIHDDETKKIIEGFIKNGVRYKYDKQTFNSIKSVLFKAISRVKSYGIDKTIYEIFCNYTKEQVDYAIANLSQEEFNLLTSRFGNDFNIRVIKKKLPTAQRSQIEDLIINKRMRQLLEGIKDKTNLKVVNIYDYFNEYGKSDIDTMLKRLNEDELSLLKKKFGDNLTLYVRNANFSEEERKKYIVLNIKMKRLLKNPNTGKKKTLFGKYSKYPKKDILIAIEKLSEVDKKYLKVYYGEEYEDSPIDVPFIVDKINAVHIKLNKILKKLHEKGISIYEYFSDYPKDTVNLMLFKLNEKELILLKKKFGDNLDSMIKRMDWSKEEAKNYVALLAKMKRILKNPKREPRFKKEKLNDKKKVSIYEYFSDYSKEDIDIIISKLNEEELILLKKKFGENLDSLVRRVHWESSDDYKKYTRLYTKILRQLESLNNTKISIYEYFNDYPKDIIDNMLSNLSENEIRLVKIKFGENLDNYVKYPEWTREDAKAYCILLQKMKRHLNNPQLKPRKTKDEKEIKIISIYEYFNDYTQEDIDNMLSKLNDNEIRLVKIKFGENLDNFVRYPEWTREDAKAYNILLQKTKRHLKNPNVVPKTKKEVIKEQISIYEYFNKYTKEDIDIMLSKLNEEELGLLKKKFGEDLSTLVRRVAWDNEDDSKKYTKLYCKIQRLLKNPNTISRKKKEIVVKDNISIYEYFSDYSKENIDNMLSKLNEEELTLLRKKFGENLDCLVKRVLWNNEEESKKYIYLYTKMTRYLKGYGKKTKKSKRIKTIYEILKKYSKEDIDNVIVTLTEEEKRLINLNVNIQDFEGITWTSEMTDELLKISKKIKMILMKSKNKQISIYEYFSDYSKEKIDEMLTKLNEEELKLLKIKFGDNLENFRKRVIWDNKEDAQKYVYLYSKMKRLLAITNKKTVEEHKTISDMYDNLISLYELFPEYSKEQVDKAIITLSSQERYSLNMRYGEDLSKAYVRQNYMSHALCNIILKIRKNLELETPELKQEEVITENVYEDIKYKDELDFRTKKVYNNMVFHHILSLIPRMEAIMLELRFGFYGKVYSTSEIAHLFDRSELDVIRILKDALEQVKMLTNPVVEEMISIIEQDVANDDEELKLIRSE